MLKLVIFAAFLAFATAAPQYPFYPMYNPYPVSPYAYSPFSYMSSPYGPAPVPYPFFPPYYPTQAPYPSMYTPPQEAPVSHTPMPAPSAPSSPVSPLKVTPAATPSAVMNRPHTYSSLVNDDTNIDLAKLYLTPEQQTLFDAAVAAMNPLEYAAQLDTMQQQQKHRI